MTRPFLPWPDKRLRQVAEPIEAVTDETRALWDEMIEIMEAMPGYGLAAPQIGVLQRVARSSGRFETVHASCVAEHVGGGKGNSPPCGPMA